MIEGTHTLRAFITYLLVHIHQKKKIALEIAAIVNGPIGIQLLEKYKECSCINPKL
jgi:hypothetical protein